MTRYLTAAAIALTFSVAPGPFHAAHAAGGGPSTTPECSKGRVWSRTKKMCVKRKSSSLTDDELFGNARTFAYAGRYRDALDVLGMMAGQDEPRVLNYRGYATRKLGDVEGGLQFYRAALRADPDYTLAREYMGEAFLTLGRVDEAKAQLAEIGRRCGAKCREYGLLQREIEAHEAR